MSNLSELFPVASSGGRIVQLLNFTTSGSYVAPVNQTVTVHGIGGGGGGGAARAGKASGGGAGAYLSKKLDLKAGDTLSWVVGAGGPGRHTNSPVGNGPGPGSPGGDTIISLNGVEIARARGGSPGAGSAGFGTVSGGVGGTATGGDINRTGGSGGSATLGDPSGGASAVAAGGGGVDLFGFGNTSGGFVNATFGSYGTSDTAAAGGGGPFGSGGSVGGYGAGSGAGINNRFTRAPISAVDATPLPIPILFWAGLGPAGVGRRNGSPTTRPNPGPMCGGGAESQPNATTTSASGQSGGEFGGGGGGAAYSSAIGYGGGSALGGGGGGAASNDNGQSGPGGPGAVFLEILG